MCGCVGLSSSCSGHDGDVDDKNWMVEHAAEWIEAGASIIGGCCRTTPGMIQQLARYIAEARCSVLSAREGVQHETAPAHLAASDATSVAV